MKKVSALEVVTRLGRKASKNERQLNALMSVTDYALAKRVVDYWLDELAKTTTFR